MGKVSDDEFRISDLCPHDIVNNSGPTDIAHVDKLIAGTIHDGGFDNFLYKWVKNWIRELHGDESVST